VKFLLMRLKERRAMIIIIIISDNRISEKGKS
jgi:hypothetical protein